MSVPQECFAQHVVAKAGGYECDFCLSLHAQISCQLMLRNLQNISHKEHRVR